MEKVETGGNQKGRRVHLIDRERNPGGKISFGAGLYQDTASGVWYERPWIAGKRTWRRLQSRTKKEAREEIAVRRSDQARSRIGLAINPYSQGKTVAEIIDVYSQTLHLRESSTTEQYRDDESRGLGHLKRILGEVPVQQVGIRTCDLYAERRLAEFKKRPWGGHRTVDMELQALSNAFNHAVRAGVTTSNPILSGRPRYRLTGKIRHARQCMPESGTELHQLAHWIAEDPDREPQAWQCMITALTGCRTNEILRLRVDAKHRQPGCIEGDWLWIERSKGGVNPYVIIHPDLRECLAAHRRWLTARHPNSPWWFPGKGDKSPVYKRSLVTMLADVAKDLGLGPRTAHGLRAFYVTVRRGQGISDGQVAAEIGDRSVMLISSTYGQVPPCWRGGPELSWRPLEGEPFWGSVCQPDSADRSPVHSPLDSPPHELFRPVTTNDKKRQTARNQLQTNGMA